MLNVGKKVQAHRTWLHGITGDRDKSSFSGVMTEAQSEAAENRRSEHGGRKLNGLTRIQIPCTLDPCLISF